MALWRCPHCGTPQPVAARCWVCRRSSTSCGTCRHFRASVAARIGYCGLDRDRQPLAGDEIRGCWVGRLEVEEIQPAAAEVAIPTGIRDFVPVETVALAAPSVPAAEPDPEPAPATMLAATPPAPDGLLWADLEP
jgi:hypothetical protein